ncbi:hypothetical protein ROLI_005680 [Roseobacter fucihabitans]|uniref:DNA-binding protein n=2 Tax=Roseobacter fucihabitans TaxID=1537242 RepID=A0ABZ2BRL8_9RHOB|nr:hypothetical protein [Roseobacter litoralis]
MRFDPQAIVCFKQQLFRDSEGTDCLNDEWVSLKRAGQVFGYSLDHVCALILDGELNQLRHRPNALSLYDLHLNKKEVLGRMSDAAAIGCSKADLKQILGINDPTVAQIVRKGMIASFGVKNPLNHRKMIRFTSEAIDSFLREYLPLGLFARNAGMQPRAAMLYIEKLELHALDWPRKFSRVYRRTGLPSEIAKMQIEWSLPTG